MTKRWARTWQPKAASRRFEQNALRIALSCTSKTTFGIDFSRRSRWWWFRDQFPHQNTFFLWNGFPFDEKRFKINLWYWFFKAKPMVMVSGPISSSKHIFSLKRLSVRRQTMLRPSLVLIFQGEADGDGFGSKFLLETWFSVKGHYVRRQRILRPLLVSIFQGEADGDGFGTNFLIKTHFFSETAFPSTPEDFKTIFGTDLSRRSRWWWFRAPIPP